MKIICLSAFIGWTSISSVIAAPKQETNIPVVIADKIENDSIIIIGQLRDYQGVLPYATVMIKATHIGMVPRPDGNFRLAFAHPLDSTHITLMVYYIGYIKQEFPLALKSMVIDMGTIVLEVDPTCRQEDQIIPFVKRPFYKVGSYKLKLWWRRLTGKS